MTAAVPGAAAWMAAAALFALALIPCAAVALRGPGPDRLIALEMTGVVETLLFFALAAASGRGFLADLGLALALLSLGGGLVFARFLERLP